MKKCIVLLIMVFATFCLSSCNNKENIESMPSVYYNTFTYNETSKLTQLEIDNSKYDVVVWKSFAMSGIELNDISYSNTSICTYYSNYNDKIETGKYVFARLVINDENIKNDMNDIFSILKDKMQKENLKSLNGTNISSKISFNVRVSKEESKYFVLIDVLSYNGSKELKQTSIKEEINLRSNRNKINTILELLLPKGQKVEYKSLYKTITSYNSNTVVEVIRNINKTEDVENGYDYFITSSLNEPISMSSEKYNLKGKYSDDISDFGYLFNINNDGFLVKIFE